MKVIVETVQGRNQLVLLARASSSSSWSLITVPVRDSITGISLPARPSRTYGPALFLGVIGPSLMMFAPNAKGAVDLGVAALMRSGGGGDLVLEPFIEIATGDVTDDDDVAWTGGVRVGVSRVTVSTRPASSSSVMLAVRSELSSGTNSVSRSLDGVRGTVVLSSVRFPASPPVPFRLPTASSDDTPVSPLWSGSTPSSASGKLGSSSNSSSSSGGSTSASRSATNRQLGHKKLGQLGP
jgi:hypothetical protein